MCGRFEVLSLEEVEETIAALEARRAMSRELARNRRAHAFPGNEVALITPRASTDEGLAVERAVWGFAPEWSKRLVFNTRIEKAAEGAVMWRAAVEQGRCIVPVAAFFEPHETETVKSPRTGRPMKRPYRFADPDDAPLLLAGVREGGRFSIVTCEPNRQVSPIHPRMPLVLRFEEVPTWLSPDWAALADRSGVELAVAAEQFAAPSLASEPDQLSLF